MTDVARYTLPDGREFAVPDPYYLASCDACGWVGSSEECGTDYWGDCGDVFCPKCYSDGADCGQVAETAVMEPRND
ncbi:hypothetical protein CLG96_01935 [Sphingomonas oleivorans]|uniref:Uncharacterized protein n=1 Tax=Sphingomonas oleivorans TaxID=1735121 RepID=A0A2T5G197_9SPHN|nr:hypothetical protein CLG96_01935 [Sphingomonas oleivorans]